MKDRYSKKFLDANQEILALHPANTALRIVLAYKLHELLQDIKNPQIIELGVGEGDLTEIILTKDPRLPLDLLDVSQPMLDRAKKNLPKDANLDYIVADAYDYLHDKNESYDIITSAWTIHNFTWPDKKKLFRAAYQALRPNGNLLIMDKIYTDNETVNKELLEIQIKRDKIISDQQASKDIIEHEHQDYTDEYRMEESKTKAELEKAGFKNFEIIDRIERDVVFISYK